MIVSKFGTRSGALSPRLAATITACALIPLFAFATVPAWWSQRGVLNPTAASGDYSPANQGQLKNIAKAAAAVMDARLPGGAGDAVHALVNGWSVPNAQTNDFAPLNAGQLKNVATLFYDRLIAMGLVAHYPWTENSNSAEDFAICNIGQLKNLFSFEVPEFDPLRDSDNNGLPDAWEGQYFGRIGVDPSGDTDADGLTNLAEYLNATDPSKVDSDGDAISDGWEVSQGLNPLLNDASLDPDGDRFTNLQEYQNNTDPNDYYNGAAFHLAIASGNNQVAQAGQWLSQPLVVQIIDSSGAALINAPANFSVAQAAGAISLTSRGTPTLSLTVRTDSTGHAQVYHRLPATSGTNSISVQAGKVSIEQAFFSAASLPSGGMALWLRGDSGVVMSGGNAISTWMDSSGKSNNAVQSSGGSQPTLAVDALNGRPVVHFNGNQYLALPNLMSGASAGEIFMVVKSAMDGGYRRMMRFGTSGNGSCYPWVDGNVYDDFGSTVQYFLGNPPQALNQYHIYNVSSKTNEWVARFDGLEEHRETSNTVAFSANPLIGHSNSENFAGDMAEIIIYDNVLTPNERKATENYLGSKYALLATPGPPRNLIATAISSDQVSLFWGYPATNDSTEFVIERETAGGSFVETLAAPGRSLIDTTVVAGGTYVYRIRTRNYSGTSDPSNEATVLVPLAGAGMPMNGMRLWLKADCATNPVADWLDQSGGNNNAVQSSGGSQPTLVVNALNGRPVVHFNGNQYLALPNLMTGASAGEIFMVVKSATDGGYRRMMRFGTSGNGSAYPWVDGKVYEDFGSTVQYGLGNPPQALNQYHIYNVSSKTNEWVARFDGLEEHRETSNIVAFSANPLIGHSNSENFAGDMAEIIIYDHVLTLTERDRVQYYLAAEYLLADFDLDGDGLTNAQETSLGTNPYIRDSNGDGVSDGAEYWTGLSPTSDDVDGDGLTNAQEIAIGTNPFLADTDRDDVPDSRDAYPLDPTRWQTPTPDPGDHTAPIITLIQPPNALLLP